MLNLNLTHLIDDAKCYETLRRHSCRAVSRRFNKQVEPRAKEVTYERFSLPEC